MTVASIARPVAALVLVAGAALAHGGGPYRGPGEVVPPAPCEAPRPVVGPTQARTLDPRAPAWRQWWRTHGPAIVMGRTRRHHVFAPWGGDDHWMRPDLQHRAARRTPQGPPLGPPPNAEVPTPPIPLVETDPTKAPLAWGWRAHQDARAAERAGCWPRRDPAEGAAVAALCQSHPDPEVRARAALALALAGLRPYRQLVANTMRQDPDLAPADHLISP